MAELYSQYVSGLQFTAGALAGSTLGTSGLNPIVDRLNSITTDDNLVTGSVISGTSTVINRDKTSYWSCPGQNFKAENPDTDQINYLNGYVNAGANGITLYAPVFLPHNAVITSVLVEGNAAATAETYTFRRHDITTAANQTIGNANIGTADTTLSNATVDNQNYTYSIVTSSLDTGDRVYGVTITYTEDTV